MSAPTATGKAPEYHATLSDGLSTIGLIAASGSPSIRRIPRGSGVVRKSMKQQTWIGGRGNRRFAQDQTRFLDSASMTTYVPGKLIPGPLAVYGRGYRVIDQLVPAAEFAWGPNWGDTYDVAKPYGLYDDGVAIGAGTINSRYLLIKFTASASYNTEYPGIWVRCKGAPSLLQSVILNLELWTDAAGNPGAQLRLRGVSTADADISETWNFIPFNWAAQAVVVGTAYWLVISSIGGTAASHYQVLTAAAGYRRGVANSTLVSRVSNDFVSFNSSPFFKLYYRLEGADYITSGEGLFFEYKRAAYMVTKRDDGTAATLWMNGDRGVATGAQTLNQLVDTTKAWSTNEWTGCVALISAGPGRDNWARIAANNATVLTLVPLISGTNAWPILPVAGAAGSEYVILGSDKWTQITGHGLTLPCTDVEICNSHVYFAQGDTVAMRRMIESNVAGVWTRTFAADSSVATLIEAHQDGKLVQLYRIRNDTVKWSKAPGVTTWVNLTFGGDEPIGNVSSIATAIAIYNNEPWISKEDDIGPIRNGEWKSAQVPIRWMRDPLNGKNMKGWNTQLFFPFAVGLERLYGQQIDDIGPNRDEGLPFDRRGRIADFVPVLGLAFAAVDAGPGYSSILATIAPGAGWHELYRAPKIKRIRNLFYQSIPGLPNRLWFFEGNDIGWVFRERDTHSPLNDTDMPYRWESSLVTSWFDLDSPDLDHFYSELRVLLQRIGGAAPAKAELWVDYQVDPAAGWVPFTAAFASTAPFQLQTVGNGLVTGQQLQLRVRFQLPYLGIHSTAANIATFLLYYEMRANEMNEVQYQYHIDVQLKDNLMLLNTEDSPTTASAVLAILESWKEDATPLTLRSVVAAVDNKQVHLAPVTLVPKSWSQDETELVGAIVLVDV